MQAKVIAVLSNRNSFGLTGHIIVCDDGTRWQFAANDLDKRKVGDTLQLSVPVGLCLAGMGFEIPQQLQRK